MATQRGSEIAVLEKIPFFAGLSQRELDRVSRLTPRDRGAGIPAPRTTWRDPDTTTLHRTLKCLPSKITARLRERDPSATAARPAWGERGGSVWR